MKFSALFVLTLLGSCTTDALLIPSNANAIARRHEGSIEEKRDTSDLWKRKGGGGGGKGGGSSSSGSSSSGSSGGSSSSGSSSSSAGGSRGSNSGGSTSAGSGARPAYGGGRYYGGGAAVPYTAGARSAKGIAPVALLGVGGLVFFGGGLWLYGAYMYPYSHPYSFYNASTRANQTKPVKCLCQQYSVCGCDDNDDPTFMNSLIGNGTTAALNQTLVRVATVNDTDTIFINGTLPNGTTASGGSDSTSSTASGSTSGVRANSMQTVSWLVIGGAFAVAMSML